LPSRLPRYAAKLTCECGFFDVELFRVMSVGRQRIEALGDRLERGAPSCGVPVRRRRHFLPAPCGL